tara:strand:- start:3734 stop:4396 length:663 start_codon:yes stop_codon:yes gene_type:complete
MRVLRRYDHGGTHFEDLSDKQKAFQRAVDTIEFTGDRRGEKKYGVGDLLSMLQFTNVPEQKTGQAFMDDIFSVSSPEEREVSQPNFRAFKTKDGSIRITSLDPESGKYNPSTTARGMSGDQLSDLAGRPLTGTEEREFRSLLMSDPSFLDYFIGIEEEEPKRREFKKINVAKNVGRRGVPGGGKGNVAGSRSLSKAQGDAGIVDFLQDFCERNSRHPSCR